MQHVSLGADFVPGNHRPVRITQQSRVDPREVPEVGEVLHLPRGIALPAVRPGGNHRPGPVVEFRHPGKRPARLFQGDPHQAVALLGAERPDPRLSWHAGRILQLGDGYATPIRSITPTVISTDELISADPAEGQGRPAVHAQIRMGPGLTVSAAPHDQRLAQEISMNRLVGDVAAERDGMPASPQRPPVSKGRGRGYGVSSGPSDCGGTALRPGHVFGSVSLAHLVPAVTGGRCGAGRGINHSESLADPCP